MKRGDLVTVALQGEFGKPRPALIVQSDLFNTEHATLSVLPITSETVSYTHLDVYKRQTQ